jgi:hypothetical protein
MIRLHILTFHHYVAFPLAIWLGVAAYSLICKYAAGRKYNEMLRIFFTMGVVFSVYPYMLGLEGLIHKGVPMARMYILYVQFCISAVGFILALWAARLIGINLLKSGKRQRYFFDDPVFLPVTVLPLFAVYTYLHIGIKVAAFGWLGGYIAMIAAAAIFNFDEMAIAVYRAFRRCIGSPRIIIVIFCLTFALRALFLCHLIHQVGTENYIFASDDGDAYERMALEGVKDMGYFAKETPASYLMFYSAFLAAVYKLFGHNYYIAGCLQALLSSLMVVAVYLIAQAVFRNRAISFAGAILACIDQPLMHLTTTLNTEALYIPLLTFAILSLVMYKTAISDRAACAWVVACGAFLGLAVIIRELIVLLPVFLLPWILVWGRDYDNHRMARRAGDFALIAVCMAALILPITVKNYQNTGKFNLVYKSGGDSWGLASHWGEENDPSNAPLIELGIDPFADLKGSVVNIFRHPVEFTKAICRLVPLRMRNLFLWPKFGYFDPVYMFNPYRIVSDYGAIMILYYMILVLISFAALAAARADTGLKILITLPIIYYCLFHGVFFLLRSTRYSAPMTPFLSMILAVGLAGIWVYVKNDNNKRSER